MSCSRRKVRLMMFVMENRELPLSRRPPLLLLNMMYERLSQDEGVIKCQVAILKELDVIDENFWLYLLKCLFATTKIVGQTGSDREKSHLGE